MLLLVGGPSNVGKTTAARVVAADIGCKCLSVDDLHHHLDDSALGFFGKEGVWQQSQDALFEGLLAATSALHPSIRAFIEGIRRDDEPVVIEGEGIEPAFCSSLSSRTSLRAVFVIELDQANIDRTLTGRDSVGAERYRALSVTEQSAVCVMNVAYARWLRRQAVECGYPWVPSQPLSTLPERLADAVS